MNRRIRLAFSGAAMFSALALGATPALANGVHTDDSASPSPSPSSSEESASESPSADASSDDAPDPREGL
ncbi:MAG TPA: hypothetical protein VGJ41_06460, partial [Nocardioides sp.]